MPIEAASSTSLKPLQLLQASVDEDDDSYLRFSCSDGRVRYLTIAAGTYTREDMCFAPALIPLLPTFPSGEWNDGYIARKPGDGAPYFSQAVTTLFPGIQGTWHTNYIDYNELDFGQYLRTGIYEVTSPKLPTTAVAKFARFAWEIDALERECAAYQWIEGKDIGPRFLGNVTEEGRVIGFVMENIPDARHASIADLALCEEKLSSLHSLYVLHGDINRYNFLIVDHGAVLIDFDTSRKCWETQVLAEESQSLREQLADTSGRGGTCVVDDESP